MKKYYNMAVESGHNYAMNNLGLYYEKIEKVNIYYIPFMYHFLILIDCFGLCYYLLYCNF